MSAKSRRQPWPQIRKTSNHGKAVYLCDARVKGRGQRRFFDNRQQAEGFAQQQRVKRANEGGKAFDDRALAAYGWNIQDAIRFALEHLARQSASVPVMDAASALIDAKASSGRSARYCRDLRLRLGRLCAAFDGRIIATINTADLEAFLAGLNGAAPETRNSYRRNIATLWGFAEKRGWAAGATARNTEVAKDIEKPPGILTCAEAAALLAESKDDDLLAYHSIGLFAGLRCAEIAALDWKDVDLAGGGFIHVGAKISKTRSRRLVPILDNLRAWLQPIAKPSGPVVERELRYRHEAARERAGIKWLSNCMRHSFVSYRLASTGDAARTALESGHDQAVLFAHYREIVRPKDAERFFAIMPASEAAGEKIVALAAG